MKIEFSDNEQHQLDAIRSTVDLFDGQLNVPPHRDFDLCATGIVSNHLNLSYDDLLVNLQRVQSNNGLEPDLELKTEPILWGDKDEEIESYYNFTIDMETGTGKTYIYLRTCLELFQKYGFHKFIIVVPSVAIREGVLKTLEITKEHFGKIYRGLEYDSDEYDSNSISRVLNFARHNDLRILVMTVDSFNKQINVVHKPIDSLRRGGTPLSILRATRPILILDEPQTRAGGAKSSLAIGSLFPLMTLRYSATHRSPYNMVYQLSPYEAYNKRLVKRVVIHGARVEDNFNHAYVRVQSISSRKGIVEAVLKVNVRQRNGLLKPKDLKVHKGDHLYDRTKLPEYQGVFISQIEPGEDYVAIKVGGKETRIFQAASIGDDKDEMFRWQIRASIEEHFTRQRTADDYDIKVLTLYFIDRVDNFDRLSEMFDQEFEKLKPYFPEWADKAPHKLRDKYFAKTVEGNSERDKVSYNRIMRDKEGLLSFDDPVAFIFSHSALNEGWDNPNVFQVCTLREVRSDISKRQQIGRGIRLPVDKYGRRVRIPHVNTLTVIANESYSQFVEEYQLEIEREGGKRSDGLPLKDVRDKQIIRRSELTEDFKALWEKIKHKTRFSVNFDSDELIRSSASALSNRTIRPPRIVHSKGAMAVDENGEGFRIGKTTTIQTQEFVPDMIVRDLVTEIADELKHPSPRPVALTRRTIWEIIKKSGRLEDGIRNPRKFVTVTANVIRNCIAGSLLGGIRYERIGDSYEMTSFKSKIESWAEEDKLKRAKKSIYDKVQCESNIESKFLSAMDDNDNIKMYVKLPGWFVVDTPIGNYNPDWAILVDGLDGERLYLIRETKGDTLRQSECYKVKCAEAHFAELPFVDYGVIGDISELYQPREITCT